MGEWRQPSGLRYTGEWHRGMKHGQGFLEHREAAWSYRGMFRDDYRSGSGEAIEPDGTSYRGEWEQGKEHGRGVATTGPGPGLRREGLWWRGEYQGPPPAPMQTQGTPLPDHADKQTGGRKGEGPPGWLRIAIAGLLAGAVGFALHRASRKP